MLNYLSLKAKGCDKVLSGNNMRRGNTERESIFCNMEESGPFLNTALCPLKSLIQRSCWTQLSAGFPPETCEPMYKDRSRAGGADLSRSGMRGKEV